ncbi:MAG: GDP-mannose 4,6-dehydratase [Candidatus Hydrogenedentes bacterium]|nr:GDP-mannose 4,6-dehydratase [Candidatus Hydrogenedentota bacterium]
MSEGTGSSVLSKCIVIGGAGFIGCNTVHRFMQRGYEVVAVDNLSRTGGDANLAWLQSQGPLTFVRADIRDAGAMTRLLDEHGDADTVLHLAGQVAVTTSVRNPREDFEINALGTLNILEAIRLSGRRPLLMYASTNKVYGGMDDVAIEKQASRYAYRDYPLGIAETAPLDFHSPYGCSKGAADQYIHDYHRIYGLPTVVFRQSCIYGYRQFGVEDQGWVAWFVIAALLGRDITICGDGKQVRDVLFIDDLTELYAAAAQQPGKVAGKVFNIGGGPAFTMSVWAEFGPLLEEQIGKRIPVTYADWRPGDQPVYISDIRKITAELGWKPATSVREGVAKLVEWVRVNKGLFE